VYKYTSNALGTLVLTEDPASSVLSFEGRCYLLIYPDPEIQKLLSSLSSSGIEFQTIGLVTKNVIEYYEDTEQRSSYEDKLVDW